MLQWRFVEQRKESFHKMSTVSWIIRFGGAAEHSGSLNKGKKATAAHTPRDQLTDGKRYIQNNTSK